MSYLHPKRAKSPRHLALVHTLPCCVCGAYLVEAHHIRVGTMGRKASDFDTIPLCARHHNEQHPDSYSIHRNPIEFEREYGSEREQLAMTLEKLRGVA
jgi:hypothetical protein